MSIVAYQNDNEVLVIASEDEFVARVFSDGRRDVRTYQRIELAPGEAFHTKIFNPRLISHRFLG